MNINKNCRLFQSQVYSYDVRACHYNILKSLNVDVSNLDRDDKLKRNTQIGLMMRDNPKLTSVIRSTTESLINEYILRNKIPEDSIVIRQYDGFMSLKPLKITTDQYLPIDLQSIFSVFIISLDRTRFIATDGNKISIKGIAHRYEEIDKIYKKILFINYANKSSIFTSMQNIKDEILTSSNPLLYGITVDDKNVSVFLKQYGQFEMSNTVLNILDLTDVDRHKYFDYYIQPFFDSITVEFL